MNHNEPGQNYLHIPDWNAKASLEVKYTREEFRGRNRDFISHVVPQINGRDEYVCESECAYCYHCIENYGFIYCHMTDICMGCSYCLSRLP